MLSRFLTVSGVVADPDFAVFDGLTIFLDVLTPTLGKLVTLDGAAIPSRFELVTASDGTLSLVTPGQLPESTSIYPSGSLYKITIQFPIDAPDKVLGPLVLTTASLAGYDLGYFLFRALGNSFPPVTSGKMRRVYKTSQVINPQTGDTCVTRDGQVYVCQLGSADTWETYTPTQQSSGGTNFTLNLQGDVTNDGNQICTVHAMRNTIGTVLTVANDTGNLILSSNPATDGGGDNRIISSTFQFGYGPQHFTNNDPQTYCVSHYGFGSANCSNIGQLRAYAAYRRTITGYLDPVQTATNLNVNVDCFGFNIGSPYDVTIPACTQAMLFEINATIVVNSVNGANALVTHIGKVTITPPNASPIIIPLINGLGTTTASTGQGGGGWNYYGRFDGAAASLWICTDIGEILVGN